MQNKMRDKLQTGQASVEAQVPNAIFDIILKCLLVYFDCNDAIKREQNEACFSYAEREHHRGVISESRRKGTMNFATNA